MKVHPAILFCSFVALCAQVLFCSGCASGYTRGSGQRAATALGVSSGNPLSAVSVELSPNVKEKLKDSVRFDQQALLRSVVLALSNRQLLGTEKRKGVPVLEILVTQVRVRNSFNAIMWGAMSGHDCIRGDLTVRDATGGIIDQFHIDASYALGGWAGGQDSTRMTWLYDAFAKQVVKVLTGEAGDA